eukprot:g1482.t1
MTSALALLVFACGLLGSADAFKFPDPTGMCPSEIKRSKDCTETGCGDSGVCVNKTCLCLPGFAVNQKDLDGGCVNVAPKQAQILSFCGLGLLLLSGKLTRVYVKMLHFLYLPSCVIGGIYGVIFLSVLPTRTKTWVQLYFTHGWENLPSFLINLVFASLFLGSKIPNAKKVWETSGPNLMYGLATSWIQMFVGLFISLIFLVPVFGVDEYFGQTLPIGFSGGHGTAAALSTVFAQNGFEDGGSISLGTATVGLVLSVTVGIVLVNIASRRNWVKYSKMQTGVTMNAKRGITNPDKRPIAGLQTTSGDSIDSLAWHLVILGIACMIGWSFRAILILISPAGFCTFPLFPLCMMAGLFMQIILQKCDQRYRMVDRATMERISGTGLDFLIVGAIAMVNVSKLAAEIVPFLILCIVGMGTEVLCVLYLSPIMNPTCWFENAICCFGQDTGVIAAGLMLLRMVDPDEKTPVPKAFGYKQPIHSALMGGGLMKAKYEEFENSPPDANESEDMKETLL